VALGTVKWFNSTKGYGFIALDTGSADVLVHISAVERAGMSSLREGQKISFELVNGRNGISRPKTCALNYPSRSLSLFAQARLLVERRERIVVPAIQGPIAIVSSGDKVSAPGTAGRRVGAGATERRHWPRGAAAKSISSSRLAL
jgi:CspA family cold shock protein